MILLSTRQVSQMERITENSSCLIYLECSAVSLDFVRLDGYIANLRRCDLNGLEI